MTYKDSIYYKKINSYSEYTEIKARWNNILDMTESDFENNFMVITAIENTSMLGLTVDKIETDANNLYISLIHYEDGVDFNESETCISYIISRDLERENICVTRNLRDSEKDMSYELQIAEETEFSQSGDLAYQYKREEYRELEKNIAENSNNYSYSLVSEDWKDMMVEKFVVSTDDPEIDFSSWTNLGDDFYSIQITDYSEYLKLMNNYSVPDMSWYEFEYVYPIIIVRANSDTDIEVYDIESENGKSYLPISAGGLLDVAEGFKYPGAVVFVPNFRSLENSFLNVKLKDYTNYEEVNVTLSNSNAPAGEIVYKSFSTDSEIDASNWEKIDLSGSNFYYTKVTDYSYYSSLMSQYSGMREMTEDDFKNYFVVIVSNTNENNDIKYKNITYSNSSQTEIMNIEIDNEEKDEANTYSNLVIIIPNNHKNNGIDFTISGI